MSGKNKNRKELSNTPKTKENSHVELSVKQAYMYSGPIPDPSVLEKYEKIHSGAAKIILDTYKSQVNHRIKLEDKVVTSNIDNEKLGMWFAFIISMTVVFTSTFLIYSGNTLIGSLFGAGTLITYIEQTKIPFYVFYIIL